MINGDQTSDSKINTTFVSVEYKAAASKNL